MPKTPRLPTVNSTMAAKPEKEHQLFLLTKINHHKITLIAEINENNHSF